MERTIQESAEQRKSEKTDFKKSIPNKIVVKKDNKKQ